MINHICINHVIDIISLNYDPNFRIFCEWQTWTDFSVFKKSELYSTAPDALVQKNGTVFKYDNNMPYHKPSKVLAPGFARST